MCSPSRQVREDVAKRAHSVRNIVNLLCAFFFFFFLGSGSGRNQERYWFLFSDTLLYCSKMKKKDYKYQLKGRVELVCGHVHLSAPGHVFADVPVLSTQISTALRDVEDTKAVQNAFEIISKRGNFTIFCVSKTEKRYTCVCGCRVVRFAELQCVWCREWLKALSNATKTVQTMTINKALNSANAAQFVRGKSRLLTVARKRQNPVSYFGG